jgi:hypothetical protein
VAESARTVIEVTGTKYVNASEIATATQKLEVTHETEFRLSMEVPTLTGGDHEVPLYVRESPSESTATQKLAVAHETELSPPFLGSMLLGNDHEVPL